MPQGVSPLHLQDGRGAASIRGVSKKLKSIGLVAGLTIVSRVLGLMRDQLGAAVFGAGLINSAFVTAFRLPNLFRRLLGEGSLTAAFVPTLQGELHQRGRPGAFALVNQVASWLFVVTGALVLGGMVLCSQARLVAGQEERWYLSADLSVILFPYLLFVCLAAVMSATLNVLQRFVEGAVSPVLLNIAMIVSLGGAGLHWAETDLGRMHWLCGGVLVGGLLQFLLPAFSLAREGWRPAIDLRLSPGVREIGRLMIPGLWGAAIYQINIFVTQILALSIDNSAPSYLFYTSRLTELPIGVFAIAISTVVYPLISRHAAGGDMKAMAEDYLKGIRLILLINIPAAVGLAILAEPIVRVLFQRGQFLAQDTGAMAPLLAVSVAGLPFFSIVSLSTRAFFSVKDTATPVRVATISFLVNLACALLGMRLLGVMGLVLASTLAVLVQMLLLERQLVRRMPELRISKLGRDLGKILGAASIMAAVVAAGWWGFLQGRGLSGDLLALTGLIPVGLTVYAVSLWVLKFEGVEELAPLFQKLGIRIRPKQ